MLRVCARVCTLVGESGEASVWKMERVREGKLSGFSQPEFFPYRDGVSGLPGGRLASPGRTSVPSERGFDRNF